MAATSRPASQALRWRSREPRRCASRGFVMMEVLISLFIITLGLLGLFGTQIVAESAGLEAYQRVHAVMLMNDMIERINANRYAASCFRFTTDSTTGTPYLGVADGSNHATPACAVSSNPTNAVNAMNGWDQLLQGAAERDASTASIGGLPGARGCVSFDSTTNPGTYTIAVAWQGKTDSFAPSVNCGKNLYGSESKRRVVWATMQMATLQ